MSSNIQLILSLIIWVIIGATSAHYAQKRGRNYYNWFLIGLLFGIFGLIALFLLPKLEEKEEEEESDEESIEHEPVQSLPPPKIKEWFYLDSQNQQHGPVTTEYLHKMREQQVIPADTYIWAEGMEDWKKYRDIPELNL